LVLHTDDHEQGQNAVQGIELSVGRVQARPLGLPGRTLEGLVLAPEFVLGGSGFTDRSATDVLANDTTPLLV
jgi:hypothetical protein